MQHSITHYPRIYALLQRRGVNTPVAAQIVLDAMRGDMVGLMWVRLFFKARRGY